MVMININCYACIKKMNSNIKTNIHIVADTGYDAIKIINKVKINSF